MSPTERIATVAAAARAVLLPDVLTVEDLARVLHIGPSAVRALIRAGRVPAAKVGRRWLCSRVELLRVLTPSHGAPQLRALPAPSEGQAQ